MTVNIVSPLFSQRRPPSSSNSRSNISRFEFIGVLALFGHAYDTDFDPGSIDMQQLCRSLGYPPRNICGGSPAASHAPALYSPRSLKPGFSRLPRGADVITVLMRWSSRVLYVASLRTMAPLQWQAIAHLSPAFSALRCIISRCQWQSAPQSLQTRSSIGSNSMTHVASTALPATPLF